jgi:hypothetical protein
MALATRFAQLDIAVIQIANLADGRIAAWRTRRTSPEGMRIWA